MTDAAVSMLADILISNINEWLNEEISLIKNVKPELLKRVSFKLGNTQKFLQDAEKRSVTEETVKVWLDELKDISYEMEDVIDEWNTSISKHKFEDQQANPDVPTQEEKISCASLFTCCVSPFKQVGFRHDIGSKIKNIDERLEFVVNNMNVFKFDVNERSNVVDSMVIDRVTTSIINESETYGRDFDERIILSKLLSEGTSSGVHTKIPIISVVGVGGLGKTTLAKLVFNNHEVVKRFSKRIWVCVSDPFDMDKVAREILEAIGGISPNGSSRDLLLNSLKESISIVKFLLVLDDVWDEEGRKWVDLRNCIDNGMDGSRVLVTTRKEKVAKVMGTSASNIHKLKELPEGDCWSLFSQLAFSYDEEKKDIEKLEKIGREIVKRCKGLPLAARTLGNVLRFKNTVEEWEVILHSEIWKIERVDVELFPHLYLSYNELSPPIKRCFSYCSIFPKDTEMDIDELIRMWMAQGYVTSTNGEDEMELKGREYFDKLATSCFFQDFGKDRFGVISKCKMHDIVHDFAQFLTRNESTIIENEIEKSFPKKTRHANWTSRSSSILLPEKPSFPFADAENHRSILMHKYSLHQQFSLIIRLKRVRTLVLICCNLEKLPQELGSLVHLRLLNLSYNRDLKELPDSVCELCNLQTLILDWCFTLKRLPQGIGKLMNLRHLSNFGSGLEEYPKSLEKLTTLRTLSEFKVGRKHGKLEYLQNLKHLGGSFEIQVDCSGLEVTEIISDAHKSQLINNKHIKDLWLSIFNTYEAGINDAVWEALVPPHCVTRLLIHTFKGSQYPSWLTNNSHFNNLRWLIIRDFDCLTLPPLWKLPHLETLNLDRNSNIKHIGREFLGIDDSLSEAATTSSSGPVLVAFPKLVELDFGEFREWEEWEDINEEYDDEPSATSSNSIQIMPRLRVLRLIVCCKLEQLPVRLLLKALSLEYLQIIMSGISESNCHQQVEQLLSHIPKIEVDRLKYSPDNPTGSF